MFFVTEWREGKASWTSVTRRRMNVNGRTLVSGATRERETHHRKDPDEMQELGLVGQGSDSKLCGEGEKVKV